MSKPCEQCEQQCERWIEEALKNEGLYNLSPLHCYVVSISTALQLYCDLAGRKAALKITDILLHQLYIALEEIFGKEEETSAAEKLH